VESPFISVALYEDKEGPVFGEITPEPSAGKKPLDPNGPPGGRGVG
jgi:hypothetical protein